MERERGGEREREKGDTERDRKGSKKFNYFNLINF